MRALHVGELSISNLIDTLREKPPAASQQQFGLPLLDEIKKLRLLSVDKMFDRLCKFFWEKRRAYLTL